MPMLQLNPPIPLNTSRGPGLAWLLIDNGPESDLLWVVALDHNGQIWSIPNPQVRAVKNWSYDRPAVEYPKPCVVNGAAP